MAETSLDALFETAKAASEKAYAPYSKFPVGAAILSDDGKVYSGANIENLAYPEGICAEGVAIGRMIMGGGRKIETVAVYAPRLHYARPAEGAVRRLPSLPKPVPGFSCVMMQAFRKA